jgi:hypothetical protein
MGELNYWTDLMTRWGVGWVADSENKAHGKMDILFAEPYISPPNYDTVEFPPKKEILLVQKSAVNEYECFQQSNATARQEVPPQQVDAGGMRMMNKALWMPERAVQLQLRLCVEAHCRSAGHRAYESRSMWHGQRWPRMSRSLCRTVCTVSRLFLAKSATPAGYAATCDQAQRDPALRIPVHWVVKRREVSLLATSHG